MKLPSERAIADAIRYYEARSELFTNDADLAKAMYDVLAAAPAAPADPLRRAVEALYFAAYWSPDRECDAQALWTAVRDAAGIAPGQTAERLGPPRTAAPADAPAAVIARIDEYRLAVQQQDRDPRDPYKIQIAAECYAALRAEVERIVRENAWFREAIKVRDAEDQRAMDVLKERAEAAEAEVARADYATRRAVERAEAAEADARRLRELLDNGYVREQLDTSVKKEKK